MTKYPQFACPQHPECGIAQPPRPEQALVEGDRYPDIYQRWLRGASVHSLAAEYQVDWRAINHHLQKCRTMLKTVLMRDRNEVLDEIYALKNRCYRGLEKSERSLTHDEVSREVDRVAAEKAVSKELPSRFLKQTTKILMRDGDPAWVGAITYLIDMECKLVGHYETGKREGQIQAGKGTYRAAGRSPKDTHEDMAPRLAEILGQRQLALPPARSTVTNSTLSDVLHGQTPARPAMPLAAITAAQGARIVPGPAAEIPAG